MYIPTTPFPMDYVDFGFMDFNSSGTVVIAQGNVVGGEAGGSMPYYFIRPDHKSVSGVTGKPFLYMRGRVV